MIPVVCVNRDTWSYENFAAGSKSSCLNWCKSVHEFGVLLLLFLLITSIVVFIFFITFLYFLFFCEPLSANKLTDRLTLVPFSGPNCLTAHKYILSYVQLICLQYFDAVGWTAGRASGL